MNTANVVSCAEAPKDWAVVFESQGLCFEKVVEVDDGVQVVARALGSSVTFEATEVSFVAAAVGCLNRFAAWLRNEELLSAERADLPRSSAPEPAAPIVAWLGEEPVMARLYLLYDVESIRLRAMTPAEAHKYVCHSDGSECDAAVSECVAAEAPMRLYDEAHREEWRLL